MSHGNTLFVYGTIELLKGTVVKASVTLVEPDFKFGRLSTNDCVLSLETVSKLHAHITVTPEPPYAATLNVLGVNGVVFGSKTLAKGSVVSLETGDEFAICERRFRWNAASCVPFRVDSPATASNVQELAPSTPVPFDLPSHDEDEQDDPAVEVEQDEDVITWCSSGPTKLATGLPLPSTPALQQRPRVVRPPMSVAQHSAPAAHIRRASLRLTITPGRLVSRLAPLSESGAQSPSREQSPRAIPASPRSSSSRRVSELLLSPSDSFHRSPSLDDLSIVSDDSSSDEEDEAEPIEASLEPAAISTPSRPGIQRSLSLREKLLIKSAHKMASQQASPFPSLQPSPVKSSQRQENEQVPLSPLPRAQSESAPQPAQLSMPSDLRPVSPRSVPLPETPMPEKSDWDSPTATPEKLSSPVMPRSALRKSTPTPVRRKSFFGFFTTPPSTLRRKVSFNDRLFIKEFVTVREGSASPPALEPALNTPPRLRATTPGKASSPAQPVPAFETPLVHEATGSSSPRRARRLSGGTPIPAGQEHGSHRSARRVEQPPPPFEVSCTPTRQQLQHSETPVKPRVSHAPPATEARVHSTAVLLERMESIRRRSLPSVLPSPASAPLIAEVARKNHQDTVHTLSSPASASTLPTMDMSATVSPAPRLSTPVKSAPTRSAAHTTPNMSSGLRMLFRSQRPQDVKTPHYVGVRGLFRLNDDRSAQSPCLDGVKELLASPERPELAEEMSVEAAQEVTESSCVISCESSQTKRVEDQPVVASDVELKTKVIAPPCDPSSRTKRSTRAKSTTTRQASSLPKRSTRSRIPVVVHEDAQVEAAADVPEPATAVALKPARSSSARTTRARKVDSEVSEAVQEKPVATKRAARSAKSNKAAADKVDAENVAPVSQDETTAAPVPARATRTKRTTAPAAAKTVTTSQPVAVASSRTLRARR
ncbi:hypothetical protein ACM66B_005524 [Microbotryomycetes sp. NB124-2]